MKSSTPASGNAGFEPLEPRLHLSADFNGDGRDDLVWHNEETGANAVWFMDGADVIGAAPLQSVRDIDWLVAEAADFNGDGKADLLWRNRVTGRNGIWFMDGTSRTASTWIPEVLSQGWRVQGAGNLNGRSWSVGPVVWHADILWHNVFNGNLGYWQAWGIGPHRILAERLPVQENPNYELAGVGDADGDGDGDIYWVYAPPNAAALTIWIMENGAVESTQERGVFEPRAGTYTPAAVRDLDGDGIGEVLLRNPAPLYRGANLVLRLGPQDTLTPIRSLHTGWVARDAAPDYADSTGDGIGDLLWHDPASHVEELWSIGFSNGGMRRTLIDPRWYPHWRLAAVADFDANGSPDFLWKNTDPNLSAGFSHRMVYMRGLRFFMLEYMRGLNSPAWVIQGAGDYDGDGRNDFLSFNTATGIVVAWVNSGGRRIEFSPVALGYLPAGNFTLTAFADLDNARTRDLLWRDDNNDRTVAWLMDGVQRVGAVDIASPGAGWVLHSAADFDRDGWGDLLWRNGGETRLWRMNGTNLVESITLPAFDAANVLLGARDLDGDRHVEILFHNSDTGVVTVWRMRGTTRHSLFEAGVQPPSWRAFFPR